MDKVPQMISTKDLSYIADMLNWNLVAAKKTFHFANETNDQDVVNELNKVMAMHQKHYNTILNLLQ
ncbi:MAG: spore coat protein [Bacilli bacterium]|nr:spore coat protein [Bacilli bacterium]